MSDRLNGTHLDGVLVAEEVDDFESVGDDADSKELLAIVAALHHQAFIIRNEHLTLPAPLDKRTCRPIAQQ